MLSFYTQQSKYDKILSTIYTIVSANVLCIYSIILKPKWFVADRYIIIKLFPTQQIRKMFCNFVSTQTITFGINLVLKKTIKYKSLLYCNKNGLEINLGIFVYIFCEWSLETNNRVQPEDFKRNVKHLLVG